MCIHGSGCQERGANHQDREELHGGMMPQKLAACICGEELEWRRPIRHANGRAAQLSKDGADIGYVWNQAFIDTNGFMLPKNVADPAAVMKLLDGALDPVNQGRSASMSGYGPVNPTALDTGLLKPEIVRWLPTAPDHLPREIVVDTDWYTSPVAQDAFVRYSKFLQ